MSTIYVKNFRTNEVREYDCSRLSIAVALAAYLAFAVYTVYSTKHFAIVSDPKDDSDYIVTISLLSTGEDVVGIMYDPHE